MIVVISDQVVLISTTHMQQFRVFDLSIEIIATGEKELMITMHYLFLYGKI